MTLPLVITPGDAGHIGDHEEMHDLLQRMSGQTTFLAPSLAQGLLTDRPAAGTEGRFYYADDVPAMYYDQGAAWAQQVLATVANSFTAIQNFQDDVFFGSGRPWADPYSDAHGAVGDGVAVDLPAFESARDELVAIGGGILKVGRGNFLFDGHLLIEDDNIGMVGEGGLSSQITMKAGVDEGLVLVRNASHYRADGVYFYGSNVSANDGVSGSAIYIDNTGGAADTEGYVVVNCTFANFKGGGWVRVQEVANRTISNIWIAGNRFSGGSDRAPTNAGIPASHVAIRLGSAGTIADFWVYANRHDCSPVKMGIEVLELGTGSILRGHICDNNIKDCGQTQGAGVKTAYGVATYGDGVAEMHIVGNHISNPYSVGIYMLAASRSIALGNYIEGQDETDDTTLMRGAIVLSSVTAVTCSANVVQTSAFGIAVAPNSTGTTMTAAITGNQVASCPIGIVMRPNGAANGFGINITANVVEAATTTGIQLWETADTHTITNVVVQSNNVSGSGVGIGYTANIYAAEINITGNVVRTTGAFGIKLLAGSLGEIFDLTLHNNTVYGATSLGYQVQFASGGSIMGNVASTCGTAGNAATGAFQFIECHCSLWNNPIVNLAAGAAGLVPTGAEDLGFDTPTWTTPATIGAIVQRMNPAPGGSIGWVFAAGGVWKTWGAIAP